MKCDCMSDSQIFSVLPDNFFNVLSSKNNKVYADCIFLMFNYLNQGNSFGARKELMVNLLTEYFDSCTSYETQENLNSKEKALSVLRRLKQCGWIFEEDGSQYEVLVNFTFYSIHIIKSLSELKENDELEYLGYIYMIYSALNSLDISTFSDILDQIYHNTNIVMNKLKSLNANIKKYIQDLLNKKSINDLKSIVEDLFVDYKKNIIDQSYQRLKTSDNVSKYRPYIISKLNEICLDDEIIEKVVKQLLMKNKFQEPTSAKKDIYNKIDYVINSFKNFDEIISEIDRKNSKYIQMSVSKILFIVHNTYDLQGKITKILLSVNKNSDLNSIFKLHPQKYLGKSSLYNMPNRDNKKIIQVLPTKQVPFELKQNQLLKFLENNLFSKKSLDLYIKSLFENESQIAAHTLPLEDYIDYTKIILLYLYGYSNDISYKIKPLNNSYSKKGFHFGDFLIVRRNYD